MALQDFTHKLLHSQNKLYRFALRMLGSVQEAEDVVQEVIIKVWVRRKDLQHIQNMEAWCMRMVKNRSLDSLKLKANQVHEEIEETAMGRSDVTHDQEFENRDTLNHIGKIIEQLPPKQMMCIQLREVEACTYEEISEILEISLDQVRSNIFRARKKIRASLIKLESTDHLVGRKNLK